MNNLINKICEINSRSIYLISLIFITFSIIFALYLQYFQNLAPCPLCMLQRIVFITIGVITLIAFIHNPSKIGYKIYSIINLLFCLIGTALAGRHMWLESLPADQAPACGPSLEVMLELFPLSEVLTTAIMGTGDCAKVNWSLLGFSLADLAMLGFVFLFVMYSMVVYKFRK